MKVLFWLLVLANVGYFLWARWDQPVPPTPVLPVHPEWMAPLTTPGLKLVARAVPPPPGDVVAPAPATAGRLVLDTQAARSRVTPAVSDANEGAAPALDISARVLAKAARVSPPASGRGGRVSTARAIPTPLACVLIPLGGGPKASLLHELKAHHIAYQRTQGAPSDFRVLSPALGDAAYQSLINRLLTIKVVFVPFEAPAGRHRLSFGLFHDGANARRMLGRLARAHVPAVLVTGPTVPSLVAYPRTPRAHRLLAALKPPGQAVACPGGLLSLHRAGATGHTPSAH